MQELVREIVDGKVNSGQENHVEKNILKGLNCAATMTELVALALYGVSVSWPYMATVRGTGDRPINLITLTPLHRKLPEFCTYIAANPNILLDSKTPLNKLTIDGRPFRNQFLIDCIKPLLPDLPNLPLMITAMFSGCETGWIQFTPEFRIGGTFDLLTPWQLATLFIPSTNDCSEGMFGTFGTHIRYHPNSNPESFTNQTRVERNNTEAFIRKVCTKEDEKFVMREVRCDGASGRRAQFRRALAAFQREKAALGYLRREKKAAKKKLKAVRLAAIGLEFDLSKIATMSSVHLKDQLQVYKDVVKDEELVKKRWKEMTTVAVRRELVLQARTRELARRYGGSAFNCALLLTSLFRALTKDTPSNSTISTTGAMSVDEFGYSAEEDAEWEDEDD
jgi:hypothetical protein